MKKILIYGLISCFLLLSCNTKDVTREKIEWSNFRWENESDQSMPRVLFIGNSISKGYYPIVSKLISEKANSDQYATSRSVEDPAFYDEAEMAMGDYNHAVIHFNNGLHGWHLNGEEYEKYLERFVRFLLRHKSRECRLIYSLTTPVSSEKPGQKLETERNPIVIERNEIAKRTMNKFSIPVIDLYSLLESDLNTYVVRKGNLHFNQRGYKLIADVISKNVLEYVN